MADRYEVLGYTPEERDDNTDLDHGKKPEDQKPDDQVVFTTDDKDEAEAMRQAGGFVKDDKWTVVTAWRDTQKEDSGALKKSDV